MGESASVDESVGSLDLKPLYARSVLNSFSSGTVSPFLGVYAVKLGASASEMGWFQSVSNLAPNMMQVPWGKLSDRIDKRIPLVVFGGLITAVLWIPLLFISPALQLIEVIAIQLVLGSMAIPAWAALIGDLVHPSDRGKITASINRSIVIGSVFATLAAGYLMTLVTGTLQQTFFVPIVIAVFCGAASSLVVFRVRENPRLDAVREGSIFGLGDVFKHARSSPDFSRFTIVSIVFGFFMSISWPLFSITTISVLNASMLEVALIGVIQSVATIALQPLGGKLVDRAGRRELIIVNRIGLVLVPVFYGLASGVYHLYLLSLILGTLISFGDIAMSVYLLDVTPEELRGTFTAFYNLVTGIVTFAGSLVGGYLASYFIGILGLVLGLQVVYAISAVGRGVSALAFTMLKEPFKYPSTLKKELWQAMLRIPSAWERG